VRNSASGRYEISVEGWFAAAHQLRLASGALEPLHGHNWRVRVTFAGTRLDGMGVLVDFTRVQPQLREVLGSFHDRHLNDLPAFASLAPSAENVAAVIAGALGADLSEGVRVAHVEVEEAPGCTARYFPPT